MEDRPFSSGTVVKLKGKSLEEDAKIHAEHTETKSDRAQLGRLFNVLNFRIPSSQSRILFPFMSQKTILKKYLRFTSELSKTLRVQGLIRERALFNWVLLDITTLLLLNGTTNDLDLSNNRVVILNALKRKQELHHLYP